MLNTIDTFDYCKEETLTIEQLIHKFTFNLSRKRNMIKIIKLSIRVILFISFVILIMAPKDCS